MARGAARHSLAARFALVGLAGLVVNQLALAAGTELLGLNYLISAIIATQISSTSNFIGSDWWVFSGRRPVAGALRRYAAFLAVNNTTLVLRIPLLWALVDVARVNYLWSNVATLVVLFVARFLVADNLIWRRGEHDSLEAASTSLGIAAFEEGDDLVAGAHGAARARAERAPQFRYDISGLLRLDSDVELPELAYFLTGPAASASAAPANIRIRIQRVGGYPTRRTRLVAKGPELTYLEHLGAAGADFAVTFGDPIEVRVSPLLARSRHVLYTNVIEALLRFVLVSKDHVLLHSACMAVDGKAVLLSAQTDTGKTSTVIRLVRDRGYRFLSDDMTIVSPDGQAHTFPKPMTLSYHTMASINGRSMPRRQRLQLAVQSRLHSKSGRGIGRRLGDMNIPIMSVNSVVQFLIPPPKYHITSLFDCEIASSAPISHVFLMERGEPSQETLTPEAALPQLIDNTDDAYGFPPFSSFAPHIRIGDDDYAALRRKEEALLGQALQNAEVWRLSVRGHEWAELLPAIIEGTSIQAETLDDRPAAEPSSTDLIDTLFTGPAFADNP